MVNEGHSHIVRVFYTELEKLAESHEELTDTDVRESLHLTLNYYFVWGNVRDRLPVTYGMFSLAGDRSIAKIVNNFLSKVETSVIPVGKERLNSLQDPTIVTPGGCMYDQFIGHSDEPLPPDELSNDLFEPGDY